MREITEMSEFQQLLDSGEPFVIWFGATWCGPCRALDADELEAHAKKLRVTLLHCDVDAGKKIAAACRIKKIPTFISFRAGDSDRQITTAVTPAAKGFLEQFADA